MVAAIPWRAFRVKVGSHVHATVNEPRETDIFYWQCYNPGLVTNLSEVCLAGDEDSLLSVGNAFGRETTNGVTGTTEERATARLTLLGIIRQNWQGSRTVIAACSLTERLFKM